MQATLPWSIHYLKADTLHSQTPHFYQPALVKSCSLVKIKKTVSRYFPIAILASRTLKNTKSRSCSQLNFPLPAPVFSSHPEYRHQKLAKSRTASRQTYCWLGQFRSRNSRLFRTALLQHSYVSLHINPTTAFGYNWSALYRYVAIVGQNLDKQESPLGILTGHSDPPHP